MSKRIFLYVALALTILSINLLSAYVGQARDLKTETTTEPQALNAAGDLDGTFAGFGGDGIIDLPEMTAHAFTVQDDGKIVVVGDHYGNVIVRRYHPNGAIDYSFGVNGLFSLNIGGGYAVAVQGDGKIVVAGDSYLGGDQDFLVLRLTTSGNLDPSFGAGGYTLTDFDGLADQANDVTLQSDGKIVVAGDATIEATFDDDHYFAVARYNLDGSLDTTFSGDGKATTDLYNNIVFGDSYHFAHSVAIQQDGKIIATGSSADFVETEFGFVRYNVDGSLDSDFSEDGIRTIGFGGNEAAYDVILQPDGKILAVGHTSDDVDGDCSRLALVRLNPDSSLDNTFGGDGKRAINIDVDGGNCDNVESLYAVDLQPDGKIVAVGNSSEGRLVLMRLNYNGDLDTSFAGDGTMDWYNGYGRDVIVQPDGKFLVLLKARMMRFLPDGNYDRSGKTTTDFSNGSDRAWAATIAPDGKIILAGEHTPWSSGSRKHMAVARYNPDGTPDLSFDNNGRQTALFAFEDGANDVEVYPDGSIIATGFTKRSDFDFAVYHFGSDGSISESDMHHIDFGYGNDYGQKALVQPDGKIVVAGFSNYPGDLDPNRIAFALARLLPDGSLDTTFGGNGDGKVLTLVGNGPTARVRDAMLQPDGKIVVVGYHADEFVVVRYLTNGLLDTSFGGGGIVKVTGGENDDGEFGHPLNYAQAVGLLAGGNIAVAGQSLFEGEKDFALLILGPDGGKCTICGPVNEYYWMRVDMFLSSDIAYDMAVQPDGKILLVGNRSGSPAAYLIVRLRPDVYNGGYKLDTTFSDDGISSVAISSGHNTARAVALYGNRIIVAGNSQYNQYKNDYDFSLAVFENDIEYDTYAPIVDSITRADANPTSAASVDFSVTFSEGVTGVDTSDFSLTVTEITAASITGISGSGDSYIVTVNTGTGTGTIRLDLKDSGTDIQDFANNPLSGGYSGGEVYTIINAQNFVYLPLAVR